MKKNGIISTSALVAIVAVGYGGVAAAHSEQEGQGVMRAEMHMENIKARAEMRRENIQERKDLRQGNRQEHKDLRQGQRRDVKEMRGQQRQERKELRQDFRSATPQEREVVREKGEVMRRENGRERRDMREGIVEERKAMREENQQERQALRGENRRERTEGRIGAMHRRAERFAAQYGRVTTKLSNIAARLADAGIDTADVKTAINVLDKKAVTLAKTYDTYENVFDGDDKNTIAAARQALVTARKDFRTYYRETVRPAIKNAILTARAQSNDA